MRIAVFASGNGMNFEMLVKASQEPTFPAEIVCVVCDRATAKVIDRARKLEIACYVVEPKHFATKSDYEKQVLYYMQEQQIDWIVLAGYMRLIGPDLLRPYTNKIINLHPSLLPEFIGKDSIQRAFEARVAYSGITIHYIDAGMDTGPVIFQKQVPLYEQDTLEQFETRIHQVEHQYYPKIIHSLLKGENIS
ncbi:phosphoribosylglycinamide formyltransferase [Enterococcus sp. AZ150]|uniref:Phosphoribosylglycinamide formyltransferase n=1 Tax=Enterococcus sulfureus ATCC 49903 TaxID=1140003 RepID=S0NRT9_9ENTE|nr:phosphoribosylglycinamide formyltransferase [Enterococcus sulfureus]EOT47560.1 phosphoribosylglycinamide formyltransferase [Enterococcus sulfureus ATCC 49903]EOT84019.1 phosphoribosylglycinamide formyltransferase [Enterococcus sulfureus ATCC 49903]